MQASEILMECENAGVHLFFSENAIKAKGNFNILDEALKDSLISEKEAVTKCLIKKSEEKNTIVAFSKVLGRDILISWESDNPKVIYMDQTQYSRKEIQQLKCQQLSAKDLKNIHNIKTEFKGELI